ncbi:MAG: hypothetical protein HYV92_11260 [Candidatus Rokubacteria bacterium]|nr:hypothetical protein [Candidatus Rokubacteria bacterium]
MRAKKLFVLFLGLAFLVGTVGLAVAQEKKMDKPAANPCAAKPAAKAKTAEGTVKSISDTSLVVEGKDKKEWTFAISGKVAESAKKLKAGDTIKISYTEDGGKMMASKVTMAKMEKKAANPCAAKGASTAPAGANPCAAKK